MPFSLELGKNPSRAERFADVMSMFESGHGSAISSLLEHYGWGAVGEGTVVDVEGSHGTRSIAIAERFPSLHCIVLDLPEVVADGPSKNPFGSPSHSQHTTYSMSQPRWREAPMSTFSAGSSTTGRTSTRLKSSDTLYQGIKIYRSIYL